MSTWAGREIEMARRLTESRHFPAIRSEAFALALMDRFRAKTRAEGECLLWTACIAPNGYGKFGVGRMPDGRRKIVNAHRFAFVAAKGDIPEGLEIDHLCRVCRCVNPDHLEAVTHRVNLMRGRGVAFSIGRTTHCRKGHPRGPANDYESPTGVRYCRACFNTRKRLARMSRREGRPS